MVTSWTVLAFFFAATEALFGVAPRGDAAPLLHPKTRYERLLDIRNAMRRHWCEAMDGADGVITLSSSGPAIKGLEYTGSRTFLVYGSWLGVPAFSLPMFQTNGMPFGLQLIGRPDADGELASVAHWITQHFAE